MQVGRPFQPRPQHPHGFSTTTRTTSYPYLYQPLKDDEIRLIEVTSCPSPELSRDHGLPRNHSQPSRSARKDELHIKITHASLATVKHKYTALSYTWGNMDDRRIVYVDSDGGDSNNNGSTSELRIIATLYGAIHRAHWACADGTFPGAAINHDRVAPATLIWADGICINQDFEEEGQEIWCEEKSRQVRMMGQIYENADRVCVDLGVDDNSRQAFDFLEILRTAVETAIHQGLFDPGKRIATHEYSRFGLPAPNDQRWAAWTRFLARPWFRRVWILQEFLLARGGFFVMDTPDHVIDLEELPELVAFMRSLALDDGRRIPCPGISFGETTMAARSAWALIDKYEWSNKRRSGIQPTLLEGLIGNWDREAGDARDKAYALLGICQGVDLSHPLLRVDYARSETQGHVYERFTRYILQFYERPLEVLYLCGGVPVPNVPSWCPDWSNTMDFKYLGTAAHSGVEYRAGGFGPSKGISFDSENDRRLCCAGFAVDTIARLGPTYPSMGSEADYEDVTKLLNWEQEARAWVLNTWRQRAGATRGMATDLGIQHYYLSQPLAEDAYRKTLVGTPWDAEEGPDDVRYLFNSLPIARGPSGPRGSQPTWEERTKIEAVVRIYGSFEAWEMAFAHFRRRINSMARGRRICVMTSGRLGLCPTRSRVEDKVVVLPEAQVPFILRKVDDGWILVGDAYIHGIMKGEALPSTTESIQEFYIL